MLNNRPAVETWVMMKEMKAAIGHTAMQRIFSVGQTQINRYCRDPKYTSDSERNPLDRMQMLLLEAQDAGADAVVLSVIEHLLHPLGYFPVANNAAPDKATSREESADDLSLFSRRERAMAEGELPCVVNTLTTEICNDVRETAVKYEQEWNERMKP